MKRIGLGLALGIISADLSVHGRFLAAYVIASIAVVILLTTFFDGERAGRRAHDLSAQRRAGNEADRQWQNKHQMAARRLQDIPSGRRPGERR